MSYFAKVINGVVTEVLSIEQDVVDSNMFGDPSLFVKTSYGTYGGVHYGPDGKPDGGVALRKNFAGRGFMYDALLDAFIPPKPYPSWLLDTETCLWVPPVPYPSDGGLYVWDEQKRAWVSAEPAA